MGGRQNRPKVEHFRSLDRRESFPGPSGVRPNGRGWTGGMWGCRCGSVEGFDMPRAVPTFFKRPQTPQIIEVCVFQRLETIS
jgi:hypothetical protein